MITVPFTVEQLCYTLEAVIEAGRKAERLERACTDQELISVI